MKVELSNETKLGNSFFCGNAVKNKMSNLEGWTLVVFYGICLEATTTATAAEAATRTTHTAAVVTHTATHTTAHH